VRAAASADDALMILGTWGPDVLLSDVEMAGEDADSLLKKARRLAAGRGRLVAVALSADAHGGKSARATAAGFDACLAKPIDRVELLSVLSGFVAQQKGLDDPKITEPNVN
jgi:CheY-like chemotaxis protein